MQTKSKKPNIVITLNSPLTENIYSRIGIENLKSFFEITLVDCLNYFNPEFNNNSIYEFYEPNNIKVINIKSLEELKNTLQNKQPLFLLDCIGRSIYTNKIQSECNKNNITYIYDGLTNTLSENKKINIFLKILSKLPDFFSKNISLLICKIRHYKDDFIRPDIVITSSNMGTLWEKSAKKRIFTSSKSYFNFLEYKEGAQSIKKLVKNEYILFLDDCLIDSFDYQLKHPKLETSKKNYFNHLKKFFDKIEKKFNMPVIIAAHPNGLYFDNYDKQFGRRKVFFNETCLLTRDCEFTLTHHSLSCHYSILFKKAIVFLDLDFLTNKVKRLQKAYSNYLGMDVINITNENTFIPKQKSVNNRRYLKFKEDYICAMDEINNPYEPLIKYFLNQE